MTAIIPNTAIIMDIRILGFRICLVFRASDFEYTEQAQAQKNLYGFGLSGLEDRKLDWVRRDLAAVVRSKWMTCLEK